MKLVLLAVFLYDIVYYHLPNINYEVGKGSSSMKMLFVTVF